jgi:hypothetical protein
VTHTVNPSAPPNARPQVPGETVERLRRICLAFPETHEERAWVGTRWRVRADAFAHVLMVDGGWPPVYARESGTDGPAVILTFRTADRVFEPAHLSAPPFFRPKRWGDLLGLVLPPKPDWDEIAELLGVSYRVMAPKRLVERLSAGRAD